MGNVLLALQAITTLLSTVEMASAAVIKIKSVIEKAHSEGRDITQDELLQISAETDALELQVIAKLKQAAVITTG